MTASRSDTLVLFGVTGDLAHKMIFPALRDGETRRSEGSGHWRGFPEVESGASAQSREGQHQAIGRDQ